MPRNPRECDYHRLDFTKKVASSSRRCCGHEGKTEVLIYDYADLGVPVLTRMHERRLRGYRAMGYEVS